MSDKKNQLHDIENASRDEIAALQTSRLKWSLNHAYSNVEHYRQKFDTAGVHVMNDTGIPLRMDQEIVDFYLPSLVEFFGEGIDTVPFWLDTKPYAGVKLVTREN